MSDEYKVRSIRMTDSIFFKMKLIAKLNKRSTTKQIEDVLEEYISRFEHTNGQLDISEFK